jgi:hypothetical protein
LVTRWTEIAGADIAATPSPQDPVAAADGGQPQERRLVLQVEDRRHSRSSTTTLLERVNRFFGWHAVGRLALRQAPLSRREPPARPRPPDPKTVQEVAKTLSAVEDEALKDALARLGAAIKRN